VSKQDFLERLKAEGADALDVSSKVCSQMMTASQELAGATVDILTSKHLAAAVASAKVLTGTGYPTTPSAIFNFGFSSVTYEFANNRLRFTFVNAMPDVNYVIIAHLGTGGGSAAFSTVRSQNTGYFELTKYRHTADSFTDWDVEDQVCHVAVFGYQG
jgi:hypothetical protein